MSTVYQPGHERPVKVCNPGFSAPVQIQSEGLLAPANFLGTMIDVHDSIDTAQSDWAAFELEAAATLFQNLTWCRAWTDTIGKAMDVSVRIVTVRDHTGHLQMILPLQIRKRQGIRVLEWLTAPHGSYGYGLFSRELLAAKMDVFGPVWQRILEMVGEFDAIDLADMPDRLFGSPHPLTSIFNAAGANLSFSMKLDADFDAIHSAKRKSEDRRANRKKEEALAKIGGIDFRLPTSPRELHETLDTMFQHQESRLAERGVHGIFRPLERQFVHRLADLQASERPVLRPYRLKCGDDVLAIMLGGVQSNVFWALISSLTPGTHRRFSPGDVALRRTIKASCEEGLVTMDFSAGDSAYKRAWADEVITLHSCLRARTMRGLAWVSVMFLRLTIKRQIKSSPALLGLVQFMRRTCFGVKHINH